MELVHSREEPSEQPKNVIPGFEQLTPQQVFNISAAHLLKQGKRAVGRDEVCSYRAPDGTQCAAGPFLTDECAKHLQGSWDALVMYKQVPDTNKALIVRLQSAHDMAYDIDHETMRKVENWSKVLPELRKIAVDFNLNTAVLSEPI